jgi:dihydrodipicolinate synthase/N-acetylneuraminate lyase
MDRNDVSWRGYWPACPTPFTEDGALDLDSLRALVDMFIDQGMHGLFVNGTTGEWFSQTTEERKQVAETAVEAAAGRVPVVVGCTGLTAKAVVELGKHALSVGASGIGSTAPPYSKTLPDETAAFYEDISDGVDGPVLVYNWPHGTNIDIDSELAGRLVDIENVVGIKDSTPNMDQFLETNRAVNQRAIVFGMFMNIQGFEGLVQDGGDGFIGGGSVLGSADARFWEDYWRGDLDAARAHAERTEALFPKLWEPGGWRGIYGGYQAQLKVLMRLMGQPGGHPRRPRLKITDPAAIEALREVLREESLLPEQVSA